MKPVKLEDIVAGMDIQSDEFRIFLNMRTGEIITVSKRTFLLRKKPKKMTTFRNIPTGSKIRWKKHWI